MAEVGIQHVNMGMSAFGKSSHWQANWKSALRGVWGMSAPTAQNTLIPCAENSQTAQTRMLVVKVPG